ncbi:tetratricopeptide repeat protein [Romboutsia sp. 13368]|uniref:tetratricopeptide repeat protein n=1 Tax=Romboutsia sp. 13368 TaxID=2708053 RepID=UPI0025CB8F75|nr:hypothetical protein [Romboutsia sp. 13368]
MAINNIFKEMFSEQKRERELKFQQEIIRKTLEEQGYNINDFDRGLELLEEEDYENAIIYLKRCADNENSQAQYELGRLLKEGLGIKQDKVKAKEYLMKAYKNGFKRAGLLLRELRYEENKSLNKDIELEFENKISDLGFTIDIPIDWVKLDPKNKNCFDAVAIDSFDGDVIFNIKMQVFLIEIPENMSYCVDLDRVANNMGCIESVNFNNGNCNGKLICGEGIDGTCEYIFVSKGKKGVYDLRVMVDKYLEPIYEDVIDHIIYSFDITDKI